jgi:L-alanine-DL-glutamate epimerase-like enolase superfamily enzyme
VSAAATRSAAVPVERVAVSAYRIPTDRPESDGTARWAATTLVLAEIEAGGTVGTGWTYASEAAATFARERLVDLVVGSDALATRATWRTLVESVRNDDRPGLASYAIAPLDVALWDLRARLHGVALCDLLGIARDEVVAYGSGGFTSYDERVLTKQLAGWAQAGFSAVKMKVGRDASADPGRVAAARRAIGHDCALFVDANGGYQPAQALAMAMRFADHDVTWYEQPVDPANHDAMRRLRERLPPGMELTSGEYLTDTAGAAHVAPVVDVLQADATRCGGYTGLLAIDGFCEVTRTPLSTHCAPMLHLHVAAAALRLRHIEYFYDHARIERMLFDGFVEPVGGRLRPDRTRPGHGLTFKHADAERFAR